jgi:hypothetical protein
MRGLIDVRALQLLGEASPWGHAALGRQLVGAGTRVLGVRSAPGRGQSTGGPETIQIATPGNTSTFGDPTLQQAESAHPRRALNGPPSRAVPAAVSGDLISF